jgi:catechol 2,3-dioxygenase-like lactoylglutathione lyase family enzyme
MKNALGLKAHHITAVTRDIEAVIAWYVATLDLQVVERGELMNGAMSFVVLGLPGYSVSFVQFANPSPEPEGAAPSATSWVHPVFSVPDPDALYRQLEAKGVRLATYGPKQPVVKAFLLFDCEGRELEIVTDGAVH